MGVGGGNSENNEDNRFFLALREDQKKGFVGLLPVLLLRLKNESVFSFRAICLRNARYLNSPRFGK